MTKNRVTLLLVIIFLVVSLISAFKYFYIEKEIEHQVIEKELDIKEANLLYGDVSSEKRIILFSDYTCVYCKSLTKKIIDLVSTTEDVAIYVYHFPLNKVGYKMSLIAECANNKNNFYQLQTMLFEAQDSIINKGEFNLDEHPTIKKASNCGNVDLREKKLSKQYDIARDLGFFGVPKLVIDRKIYSGDIDRKYLEKIILKN